MHIPCADWGVDNIGTCSKIGDGGRAPVMTPVTTTVISSLKKIAINVDDSREYCLNLMSTFEASSRGSMGTAKWNVNDAYN